MAQKTEQTQPDKPMYMYEARDLDLDSYNSLCHCTNCGGALRVRVSKELYTCPCSINYATPLNPETRALLA